MVLYDKIDRSFNMQIINFLKQIRDNSYTFNEDTEKFFNENVPNTIQVILTTSK
jgi:hypothetical protein